MRRSRPTRHGRPTRPGDKDHVFAGLEGLGSTWYFVAVAVRHAALAVSAVLVLGLGVYLFIEVRGRPAVAQVEAPQPAAPRPQPARPSPAEREPASPPAQVRKSPSERFANRSRLSTSDSPPPAEAESDPSVTGAQRLEAGGLRLRERNPQPHRFAEVMDEANKAYDRGDLDEAGAIATKVLRDDPANVRMLRIAVSSACISGDTADAQKYYTKLPPADRAQMKTRCGRYGVTFTD